MLAIIQLEPDLQVLGPFGSYLLENMGAGAATAILAGALAAWVAVPLWTAAWVFGRSDA